MKIIHRNEISVLNRMVFNFLLPSAVLFSLGLSTDLRDEENWRFVGAFLLLRTFSLVGSTAVFGIRFWKDGVGVGMGTVTSNWLFVSWISTVILGIPLLRAALGPQYAGLGAVAAISSFIFQLPCMLILFEISLNLRENDNRIKESIDGDPEIQKDATNENPQIDNAANAEEKQGWAHGHSSDGSLTHVIEPAVARKSAMLSKQQWRDIGIRLFKNPILWAICIGFILSITTLGPKYMFPGNPPAQVNCDYEPATGFFALIWKTLAGCTEPIALFATGAFLFGCNPLKIGVWRASAYMLVKLIIVPAVAIGCAKIVGLDGVYGRATVLIAALPISAASFVLASRYNIGQDEAISNLFFGNFLVLPTTLLWMVFMDAVDLFPTPDVVTVDVCNGN